MDARFTNLEWTATDGLPDGASGYVGVSAGTHVVVVEWTTDGVTRADGAIAVAGRVERLLPEVALDVVAAARLAAERPGI